MSLLSLSFSSESVKNVAANYNRAGLHHGIQAAVKAVLKFLRKNKREIITSKKVAQVVIIFTNNKDSHIGKLITCAMEKIRKKGVATCKRAETF